MPIGVRSVYTVVFIAITFPCMLLIGGLGERVHAMLQTARGETERTALRFVKWMCFGIACLIQIAVFCLLAISLTRSTGDGSSDESSDYLWRVVASTYYLYYLSFPIVYILWYTGKAFKAFWQVCSNWHAMM